MDWRPIVFVYTRRYVCVRECDDSAARLRSAQLRTRCSRHRGLNLPHSMLKLQPQFLISTVNLITYRSRDTQTHLSYIHLHVTLNFVYFPLVLSLFPPVHTTLWLFRFLPSVKHIRSHPYQYRSSNEPSDNKKKHIDLRFECFVLTFFTLWLWTCHKED